MTPQSILEDMNRLAAMSGPRLFDCFDEKMWGIARASVEAAVHFEFAGATPKQEHIEFGNELLARDLFRLPFETVLYTASFMPKTGILAMQIAGAMGWYVIAPCIVGDQMYSAPLMVASLQGRDPETGEPVNLAAGTIDWKSIISAPHASRKTGVEWSEDDYGVAMEKAVNVIVGGTALMMSKDVETRTESAPSKLNKRREQQGRPPIRERRVVVIRPEQRASYANAEAEFSGLRSSRRMHWRRGHFRHLRSGAIVPVAPSIINASADMKPIAKQYRVEASP